jgi:4,5-DOPA dioxygenase extradiol
MTQVMPVIFFGHGSPMIALETNTVTQSWRAMAEAVPRPKAILCISAHWLTRGVAVTAMQTPRTIHDFGPMSEDLFKVQYPAPGSPALAVRVRELLSPTMVALDAGAWGLDHGAWSVLMKAFPDADIPIVQLSMDATKPPAWHFEQGRRLQPLRHEGVLIMGSGNTVHNLGTMSRQERFATPHGWATRFSDAIRDGVLNDDADSVINYQNLGQDARMAQPTPDHFWPLLYALGARLPGDQVEVPVDHIENKSIGMTSFVLRPNQAAASGASVSALNG